MATFKSREITLNIEATLPIKLPASAEGGAVHCMVRRTPAVAAWAQNDIWEIATFPTGTRILPQSYIINGAFGAGVTMDVGNKAVVGTTGDDDDRFVAAKAVATAGRFNFDAATSDGTYIFDSEMRLNALLEAANPTDDIQAVAVIFYTTPAN